MANSELDLTSKGREKAINNKKTNTGIENINPGDTEAGNKDSQTTANVDSNTVDTSNPRATA
ncbi:hypothetical protein [Candidatus Albibeggiatoa sp. nov. NOAA]|uniref:hypothetical protein n=1 Tax=Candidatus Albibeggiatoa sp. nov. NOAA TaxID=3162724 RepID=UPI0033027B1B|nr:hypothetical protein [Thiotrichaceae bacterium]